MKLGELNDAADAFLAAGRALARDGENPRALELRADSAEVSGRPQEGAEALQKRLAMDGNDPRSESWKLRLGRLHAELGEAEKALPLLGVALDTLEAPLLFKLGPGARSLRHPGAVRLPHA